MRLVSEVLCPYCLKELRSQDLRMVCSSCGAPAVPTKAELLLKKTPKCSRTGCTGYASERICSYCNAALPPDIMSYSKYLRFSILGITGSGKTNFLTTMLHELRHSPDSYLVPSPMDELTKAMFEENDGIIYTMHEPVPATPAGTMPPPQLWRLKDKNKMTGLFIPSYSLTIFDGAGEDIEHIDPVVSRYINESKVLVILIDPLALPGVASTIEEDILNWSTTADHVNDASAKMVDGIADYVRNNCGLPPGKLINRDVAVVFTKIDTVRESFGSAVVMNPSPHLAKKGFDKADANAVDAEIRDWLLSKGETSFLDAIDTNFKSNRVRFFGVSSFGQPPTGNSQLGKVMPHRVLDPLLWMLSKEGIIPVV